MKHLYRCILILLILTTPAFTQIEKTRFQHLSVEDGLSQNSVTTIFQDSKGFMWFGTYDGLNKYDGYNFTTYRSNPKDPYSLSQNNVVVIFEDRKGDLWIGTENGLNIYDRDKDRFINFYADAAHPNTITNYDIQTIVEDQNGTLWLAVYGDGVNKITHIRGTEPAYDKIEVKNYKHDPKNPKSLNNNNVTCAFLDSRGVLWFGNDLGISKFNPATEEFTHFKIDPNMINSRRIVITEDSYGYLWIGTWGSGLYKYDVNKNKFYGYHASKKEGSISHDVIRAIYEDADSNLWIGTNGGGLNIYDRENDQFFQFKNEADNPNSLSNNNVISLYEDKSKILWIGTEFGGLNKFNKNTRQFHHYIIDFKNPYTVASNIITTINETTENNDRILWLGTWEAGLNKINERTKKLTRYLNQPSNPKSLCNNLIRSVQVDKNGFLWIATNGGLSRFNPRSETFTNYLNDPSDPQSLPDDNVFCVYLDRTENIWVGTWGGGLSRFDQESGCFTHYQYDQNKPGSISNNSIWCIQEDHNGVFWIGTDNAGLNKLIPPADSDPDSIIFERFKNDPADPGSLSDNKVLCIYEDKKGTLWFGTTGGLNKFNRETQQFTHYSKADGFPSNSIQAILEDQSGKLWISTNKGLLEFDPSTEKIRNFSTHDGLQSKEFGVSSCYASSNGMLYFGGANGYNAFFPPDIKTEFIVPPVIITDFQIFNKSVQVAEELDGIVILDKVISNTQHIVLSHTHSMFSFEYVSLDYNSPQDNQYAYMMEGFERDWNYVGNRRFATYINMPAGEYTFKVKATNSDKQWVENATAIQISIIPPFWETTWFNIIAVLTVLGLFYGFFRYRVRLIHQTNILLEQNVKERTTNLTEANKKLLNEINTRKTIEKELLIAKESAEIASKSKSEFLSTMSHEIRTPMNGVIGLTDLVLNSKLSSEQRNFLTMVKYSADQLLNILNDILDFSKIEAGQLDLENINFELRPTIENAGDILLHVLEQKNISLHIFIDNDVPQHMVGDPGRLRQILVNLISNSFKFTDEGAITVIVKMESMTTDTAELHISVSDTGIGIEKEIHDTIFKSFTQADSSTSRKYGGTGLGLSISKQLVEMMNGQIWLESPARLNLPLLDDKRQGKKNGGPGTTFHFTLKLKIQHVDPQDILLLPENIIGLNILAIDDNYINRLILTHMLENLKSNVTMLSKPSEALELLKKLSYDLIITEYNMPEMDGLQLVGKIRKKYTTPIILLASVVKTINIQVLEKVKYVWTLDKPLKHKNLINRITTAINASQEEQSKGTTQQNLDDTYIQQLIKIKDKVRILLAEDNKTNQKVALAILKKTGIPIDVAEDGKLVISALQSNKYDLVLMDIQMPQMDGIEATQFIRNKLQNIEIPIVATTAQSMKGDSEKCINAGMNDYLSKPVTAEKLYKTLCKWLINKDGKNNSGSRN